VFQQKKVSLGTVDVSNRLAIPFILMNKGDRNEYVLKVEAPEMFTYRKPLHAIAPDAGDTVYLYLQPVAKGNFNEEIQVYVSSSTEPITLQVSGMVHSFTSDNDIPCPTFSNGPVGREVIMALIQGQVIDSITRKPIPFAKAAVTVFYTPQGTLQSNKEGRFKMQATPNRYEFSLQPEGYYPKQYSVYLNKNSRDLLFELRPLPVLQPAPVVADTFPVAVHQQVPQDTTPAPAPEDAWKQDYHGELSLEQYAANNVVFLIDISGSMGGEEKLPVLKESMKVLIEQLRPIDKVCIVVYSTDAKVVYPPTPASDQAALLAIVESLNAGGQTNANKGLALAHEEVVQQYITGGNNQVILCTDGAFYIKEADIETLQNSSQTVHYSLIGLGDDEGSLKNLKELSIKLGGNYLHIKNGKQADKMLLDEIKRNSKI